MIFRRATLFAAFALSEKSILIFDILPNSVTSEADSVLSMMAFCWPLGEPVDADALAKFIIWKIRQPKPMICIAFFKDIFAALFEAVEFSLLNGGGLR